jgi:hypothetical protein
MGITPPPFVWRHKHLEIKKKSKNLNFYEISQQKMSHSPRLHDHIWKTLPDSFSSSTNHFASFTLMTLYGLCHSNDVKIQNFQLNTQYLYSEQWHGTYLIITTYFYKIVLISSIKECYKAMINSIDKISTRVSCSIVVVFIVFSQVDVIELWYRLVWLFDVSG